MIINQLVARWF